MICIITFLEKENWSCATCGEGFAGLSIPLLAWSSGASPSVGTKVIRTIRGKMDFIQTSKATFFGGDRTCMHNQWNARYIWDDGKFSWSQYTLLPFNAITWMQSVCPGSKFEVPVGTYSFSPVQRTSAKCYVEVLGSLHLTSYGFAITEPLTPTSFIQHQCWSNGYSQRDHYLYTWMIASGHALCLVTKYTLVIGVGSEDVVAASASWGVYCYGRMDSFGVATYIFDGVSAFKAGGLWIPATAYPRPVTADDVVDWTVHAIADPFGFLPRSSAFASQVSLLNLSGTSCSYTGSIPDVTQCTDSILRAGNAVDYDVKYVFRPLSEYEWGDLADTALDNCRFIDINSLAYLREAVQYVRILLDLILRKKVSAPSDPGSFWLDARYGMRLTIDDTKSIVDAGREAVRAETRAFSVARAKLSEHIPTVGRNIIDYKREATYKVYYNRKDDPALNVIRTALDWDLWPTLSNDWDLIPYSFVVDWFIDVEGALKKLDNSVYEAYLSVLSVLYTEKHTYVHDPSFFDVGSWKCDSCEHVFYHRRQSPSLHYAPLRLERGHLSNINVIDGVSLVMQRMIK